MKNFIFLSVVLVLTFAMSCSDTNPIVKSQEQVEFESSFVDNGLVSLRNGMCGIDTEDKDCSEVVYSFNNLLVDMAHCTTPNVYEACYWIGSISYMVCEDPATGQVEVNVSDLDLIGHNLSCALDENGDKLEHEHDWDCIAEEVMKVILPILILKEATERLEGLNCEISEYITSNYSEASCVTYCEQTLPNGAQVVSIVPCGEGCCVETTKWCFVDGVIQAQEIRKEKFGSCTGGIDPCPKGKGDTGPSYGCSVRNCY